MVRKHGQRSLEPHACHLRGKDYLPKIFLLGINLGVFKYDIPEVLLELVGLSNSSGVSNYSPRTILTYLNRKLHL